ncbi:MAG TPA: hypothetical protein PKD67_01950 [Ignavibacteriaceae bacterium]|nr:hypothetical protein [Ignavibacteriaceae bacterium]
MSEVIELASKGSEDYGMTRLASLVEAGVSKAETERVKEITNLKL